MFTSDFVRSPAAAYVGYSTKLIQPSVNKVSVNLLILAERTVTFCQFSELIESGTFLESGEITSYQNFPCSTNFPGGYWWKRLWFIPKVLNLCCFMVARVEYGFYLFHLSVIEKQNQTKFFVGIVKLENKKLVDLSNDPLMRFK